MRSALKMSGLLAVCFALGCTTDPQLTVPAGLGQLSAQLVAPAGQGQSQKGRPTAGTGGEVTEIHVTVVKVTAHSSQSGWVTLGHDSVEVDLLNLNASRVALGWADLPPGDVTQIRLYTAPSGNYVVLQDGSHVDLKVPSGAQSGIKVKGPFHVRACEQEAVDLEFDGPHSIQVHGTGTGEYILRPVIRVREGHSTSLTCTGSPDGGSTDSSDAGSGGGENTNVPGNPGDGCGAPVDCLSGDCQSGICQPGAPGTPCTAAADCASQVCQADGTCGGSAGGTENPCRTNSECLSGACTAGVCEPGGQGEPCVGSADCAPGFACFAGFCDVMLN